MPTKDSMIRARTTKKLKESAERVLRRIGMSPSQAINIFYTQIVLCKGIPFPLNLEEDDTPENYTEVKDDEHLKSLLGL